MDLFVCLLVVASVTQEKRGGRGLYSLISPASQTDLLDETTVGRTDGRTAKRGDYLLPSPPPPSYSLPPSAILLVLTAA